MKTGRKGFYEELQVKKYLSELTPKMFQYVLQVMEGADDHAKKDLVKNILPKIIDKGLPTMITGDEGEAILIQVAKEIADKNETPQNSSGGSQ